MVRASFIGRSRLKLLTFQEGKINAESNINEALNPVGIPFIQSFERNVFQQENAPIHKAAKTRRLV